MSSRISWCSSNQSLLGTSASPAPCSSWSSPPHPPPSSRGFFVGEQTLFPFLFRPLLFTIGTTISSKLGDTKSMSASHKVRFLWFFQEQSSTTLPQQTTICSLLPSCQSCSPGEIVRNLFSVESHQMSNQKTSVTGGLIPLPRDYTDLMNLAAAFTCPNNVSGPSAGEVGGRKFFN